MLETKGVHLREEYLVHLSSQLRLPPLAFRIKPLSQPS